MSRRCPPPIPPAALLLAILLVLGACRGDGPPEDATLDLEVAVAPTPPVVGPARIVLSLRDAEGEPVEDARVRLEATMDHPGMPAVPAEARDEGDGRYVVPELEFTMGGQWILRVRVELPDGTEAVLERTVRVVSAAPDDPTG